MAKTNLLSLEQLENISTLSINIQDTFRSNKGLIKLPNNTAMIKE